MEYLFLVDCSKSMANDNAMAQAIKGVQTALRAL